MICWKLRGFVSAKMKTFFASAIFTRCFGEGGHEGQGRNGLICKNHRAPHLMRSPIGSQRPASRAPHQVRSTFCDVLPYSAATNSSALATVTATAFNTALPDSGSKRSVSVRSLIETPGFSRATERPTPLRP